MLKRILLPVIFGILTYGFWVSPDFKEISAGVAIFLFGMLFLGEGFKSFTGGLLEKLLKLTTDKLWKSLGFGIVATTIMQSSSLVSVITISFLSAGLIGLASGIGIIFGANIGTTTGAWLVAGFGLKVKISAYAMPMLVFGIILVFQKTKSLQGVGYVLAGMGFLFLGIHYMKEGFEAFRGTIDLSQFAMTGLVGLFVYTGIGMAATVIMQSSHATLVLIITALSAGQITYENALALAIGANIGTTITAILGSLSANHQGKRLAGAHLIFNMATGFIAILFITQLVLVVDWVARNTGIAETDYTLKLAVFHTIFNIIGVVVMTPFIGRLVIFLEKLLPAPEISVTEPRYLNSAAEDFPETLLEAVRNESIHLYDNAFEIMAHGLNMHRHDILSDADLRQRVRQNRQVIHIDLDDVYLRRVKTLYAAIIEYISHSQANLPSEFSGRLYELRRVCGAIVQSVKDVKHLRKNIVAYTTADNKSMREEYNEIQAQIGLMLRLIHKLRTGDDAELDTFALDEFKVAIAEDGANHTQTLDALIRAGQITATMGTSLINDTNYAKNIIWNLAEIGESLWGATDLDEHAARLLVALEQEDVDALVDDGRANAR